MVKWVKSNVAGRFVHFQQVLAENASAQGVALEAPGMRNLICLVLSCPKMRNLPAKKYWNMKDAPTKNVERWGGRVKTYELLMNEHP